MLRNSRRDLLEAGEAEGGKTWDCMTSITVRTPNRPTQTRQAPVCRLRSMKCAGLADLRKILGMPEEMRVDNIETVAKSGERTPIRMRKFTSDVGGDDEN